MKICVVAPNYNLYSETFIYAHMHRLSDDIVNLAGDGSYFPVREIEGKEIYQHNLATSIFRRFSNTSKNKSEERALSKFLTKRKVDVVLAEYGPTACAVLNACQMAGIPLVAHFHGYDAFQYSTAEQYAEAYKKLFKSSVRLIAASKSMANQLCTLGASLEHIAINHYGVDVSQFSGGDPSTSPPHFVAVGRFVEKKAPHLTLLAFKKVLERVPESHLTMIGDGPLLEACKQMVYALNLSEKVSLLGSRPSAEVAQALQGARAFVQHSLRTSAGDSESLGVVFLEAGAMGLPSIGTQHDGIPEVIAHGETGLLVEEGNIDKFAEYMISLAEDPGLAKSLGAAARERVAAKFTEERSLANLRNILSDVVQNS